jgi:hypothetical protein
VKTVTLKLKPEQVQWLDQLAQGHNLSRGAVIRDLIEQRRTKGAPRSLHEQAKDLCGTLQGPKDLSTRALKGYGRD